MADRRGRGRGLSFGLDGFAGGMDADADGTGVLAFGFGSCCAAVPTGRGGTYLPNVGCASGVPVHGSAVLPCTPMAAPCGPRRGRSSDPDSATAPASSPRTARDPPSTPAPRLLRNHRLPALRPRCRPATADRVSISPYSQHSSHPHPLPHCCQRTHNDCSSADPAATGSSSPPPPVVSAPSSFLVPHFPVPDAHPLATARPAPHHTLGRASQRSEPCCFGWNRATTIPLASAPVDEHLRRLLPFTGESRVFPRRSSPPRSPRRSVAFLIERHGRGLLCRMRPCTAERDSPPAVVHHPLNLFQHVVLGAGDGSPGGIRKSRRRS